MPGTRGPQRARKQKLERTETRQTPASPGRHVFISYSRADRAAADSIRRRLDRARLPVWMDLSDVRAGTRFADEIVSALDAAGCVLLLASPASSASEWVTRELRYALDHGTPVIPVRVAGGPEELSPELRELDCVDYTEPALQDRAIGRCIRAIGSHVSQVHIDASEILDDLTVPDMTLEHVFLGPDALWPDELRGRHTRRRVPLPAPLETIRKQRVTHQRRQARERGQTLDNNLSYSMYGLSVSRPQNTDTGLRENVYSLTTIPTDFFHFVYPNLALDEAIEVEGRPTTARQELGLTQQRLRLEALPDFSCHFRIGTGTVLISSDNQVVVSIRSRHQLIVGGMVFHLSTAEGMLRPVDADQRGPSPFRTCTRALEDELGLRAGEHYIPDDDVRCLAVALDRKRAQPYFVFFVRTSSVSFDTIKRQWLLQAKDRHENRDVVGVPWVPETARTLAAGRLLYDGQTLDAASNHARFGYTIAALHAFGTDAVGPIAAAT